MSAEAEARHRRIEALLARPSSSGSRRLLVSAGAGLVVAVVLGVVGLPRYGVLAGLMCVAGVYVVWTYLALRRFRGQGTRAHASREDPRSGLRQVGATVVILGNLAAVVIMLVLDRGHHGDLDAGLALGSVVLSWFLLHTLYVPHYARLYYARPSDDHHGELLTEPATGRQVHVAGGIDFNAPGYWPAYADFTYFAFNLGMTFQVSDTSVSSPAIRRLVLGHCLLSYFFATAITATVVNLVVGLVS
ncbi:DUF1345 domain-containing protein [Microlunatus flavus]|uniref:Uncharacterized membrane protein n=1 Tax=Microlunatus flavus TaxID=1036181 RepID=A0A1H9DEZ1_9ACTN|nr:DUF1345 domain-containing protein [Microlunatus flavus]SEQ11318.1 Uncharacterized membrane protein [Microlunatus flavus]